MHLDVLQVLAGLYGNDHTEFTVIGETRDIAEDMERLSATYRILISDDFLQDLQQFSGYSYIPNTDENRSHEKVTSYWLLGRDDYPEQVSIDEIYAEYGTIEDGKIPAKASHKKAKAPAAGAATQLTERAQSRRSSIAAHRAAKEENKERPSILERRHVPQDGRQSLRGSINPDALKNLSTTLTETGVEESAVFDIMRLGNNQEIILVDFSHDDVDSALLNAVDQPSYELSMIMENPAESAGSFRTIMNDYSQTSGELFSNTTMPAAENLSDLETKLAAPRVSAVHTFTSGHVVAVEAPSLSDSALHTIVVTRGYSDNSERDSFEIPSVVVTPLEHEDETEEENLESFEAEAKETATDKEERREKSDTGELPSSHESYRQRRKKKRKKIRPSLENSAGTENPLPHLSGMIPLYERDVPNDPWSVPVNLLTPQTLRPPSDASLLAAKSDILAMDSLSKSQSLRLTNSEYETRQHHSLANVRNSRSQMSARFSDSSGVPLNSIPSQGSSYNAIGGRDSGLSTMHSDTQVSINFLEVF